MIRLTRLNHEMMILNSDLIETIESTPDTVIALVNGQRWMVRESADEVLARVIDFRRRIQQLPTAALMIVTPETDLPPGYAEEN